ncbi:MAG: YeeE/YedE family protein [Cyclobacteriaceae bacterium]|nr:YeeE/YedE family protein [Cyclobacteriaceae bacterium]MCH8515664.1 YeeE/YedE family protein [Cyclobacteriaceae bacterium]
MSNQTIKNTTTDAPINCDAPNEQQTGENGLALVKYLVLGILFGIVFVKAEIISWFRIQEMFRLQSFFMYGVIGSAIAVGAVSIQIIKRFNIKTLAGEVIKLAPKEFRKGQIIGGFIFGLGWALTGACPGPIFAQIGSGFTVVAITLLSAIAGTWVYGRFADKFPN